MFCYVVIVMSGEYKDEGDGMRQPTKTHGTCEHFLGVTRKT